MRKVVVSGISRRFQRLSQRWGQVTHVLLTRSPLEYPQAGLSVRLACVKHAASVRPEPGSNSPTKTCRAPRSCEPGDSQYVSKHALTDFHETLKQSAPRKRQSKTVPARTTQEPSPKHPSQPTR